MHRNLLLLFLPWGVALASLLAYLVVLGIAQKKNRVEDGSPYKRVCVASLAVFYPSIVVAVVFTIYLLIRTMRSVGV